MVIPRGTTWVAEASGETTGETARTVVGEMTLDGEKVNALYLDPDWRGRGIGDRFVALAKVLSPTGLTLWTFQVNHPAHRFYERHGFVAAERTDGSGNEEREPDVRYVWRPSDAGASQPRRPRRSRCRPRVDPNDRHVRYHG